MGDKLLNQMWSVDPVYASAAALLLVLVGGAMILRRFGNWGLGQLVQQGLRKRGGETLIVLAHGQIQTLEWIQATLTLIKEVRPGADILLLKYPSHVLSNADAFQIAAQMCDCINKQFEASKYRTIILVGYSRGALLLRKAYVYGHGLIEDLATVAGETREPMPWVTRSNASFYSPV